MFRIKLTVNQINYLNILLMIVSAGCAMVKPFETFLFVYAFLGPLHYLTEISWLYDKNFYTKYKFDFIPLLLAGVIITFLNMDWINLPDEDQNRWFHEYGSTFITMMSFGAALVFTIEKRALRRFIYLMAVLLLSIIVVKNSGVQYVFGAFLPTLIHVFIFTGLFILIGALKGRSRSGILSLVAFVVIACSFFYIKPDRTHYQVSSYAKESYGYVDTSGRFTDGFISLNETIRQVFRMHDFGKPSVPYASFIDSVNNYFYSNPAMLAMMAFIAFAYMYHYLNWFSKTSIIQWHRISRLRGFMIVGLWLASIGIYAYDYSLGLKWLFFLSFSHVLLEFPLNHLTFINIGKEAVKIFSPGKVSKA